MRFTLLIVILICLFGYCCNKLVSVPNPISSVTTAQVFSSDASATAAMLGIYSYMSQQSSFSNNQTTFYCGESADELTDRQAGSEMYDHFLVNNLNAQDDGGTVLNVFWQPAYFDIYNANAIISGIDGATGISSGTRNELIGEAEFVRAYCYFYLTNLFGDVPLVLTPDFNQTVLLSKSPQVRVYEQILSDLRNAKELMISDFSLSNGFPVRANKWAAMALLARVHQYQGNWDSAFTYSNEVIKSGEFSLANSPANVFLANSAEAILQLQTANSTPYATLEAQLFIPYDSNSNSNCWLTSQLLGAFEPNDLRRADWVDSTDPGGNGVYYFYPFKYKVVNGSAPAAENYMLLRLAEQYLIRAEAEANGAGGGPSAAINDLDTIRQRAGLPALSNTLSGDSLKAAVQQEWRIEFFAEWGHRWLDLKRWGNAVSVLDTIPYKKGYINSIQLLYPIPPSEIYTDPNLVQNLEYTN